MREAGLLLVQNFLLSFGRSGVPLDGPLSPDQSLGSGSSSPSKSKSSDASSLPRNWLVALLKILKLDGRWPDLRPNVTTRQQLESVDPNESAEEQEARLHFLLHASYALLELCTVPVYKAFLTHPPALVNPALEKAAPIAAAVSHTGGLLSPKVHAPVQTAAMASHPVRHVFHMLPIFFMARHDAPGVVKGFVERVMKVSTSLRLRGEHLRMHWERVVSLMRRCRVSSLCFVLVQLLSENRLSFQLFSVVLVLAQNHPEADWVAKLGQHLALVHTRAHAQTHSDSNRVFFSLVLKLSSCRCIF